MWSVSPRFLRTVSQNHELVSVCTVTPPGAGPTTLTLAAGTVNVDRSQQIRRTAPLQVVGGTAVYDLLSIPGARVSLSHGFRWKDTSQELVPLIYGELSTASLVAGDGLIAFGVADLWQRLAASPWLSPYTPAVSASRVTEIINAVLGAIPGTTIRNTATDGGTVATAQAWTSPADMITAFAADGGMEAFFGPDGAFVLRNLPQITDPVAWTIVPGDGGTLEALTRTRPLDKLYNSVIVTPATADPSQNWTQVVAQISDTSNPRHPNRIGVRPYRFASPTLLTAMDAISLAQQLLVKVQGSTETLAVGAMSNPALEAGDVIQVDAPADNGAPTVVHFSESFGFDVATGSMAVNTRSDVELTA